MIFKKQTGTLATAIVLVLVFLSGSICVETVTANPIEHFPAIFINADGTVTADDRTSNADLISKDGAVYSLTANLNNTNIIRILCSNIVFDGRGHVLNGSYAGSSFRPTDSALIIDHAVNVTVQNLTVVNALKANFCSNCLLKNLNVDEIYLKGSCENTIIENNIRSMVDENNSIEMRSIVPGVVLGDNSSNNVMTLNNIGAVETYDHAYNQWDNGSLGNYWSNYNCTDLNNDGVGDTPYVIDANNQDNHPLMTPLNFNSETLNLPTPVNQPTPTQTPQLPQKPESLPQTIIIAAALTALVAAVTAGLIIYFKKYHIKTKQSSAFFKFVNFFVIKSFNCSGYDFSSSESKINGYYGSD